MNRLTARRGLSPVGGGAACGGAFWPGSSSCFAARARNLSISIFSLLRALINPRAKQRNLLGCERLWRRAKFTLASGRTATRTLLRLGIPRRRSATRAAAWRRFPGSVGPSTGRRRRRAATASGTMLRWHGHLRIYLRGRDQKQTFLTLPRHHHFAFRAAFQNVLQAVQAQVALGSVLAMAPNARGLEQRLDVGVIRNILLSRRGRQLAHVNAANVPFVVWSGRQTGGDPQDHAGGQYSFHSFCFWRIFAPLASSIIMARLEKEHPEPLTNKNNRLM